MAALVYGTLFNLVGWRGMFVIGALPALLVIYIRTKVDESPAWLEGRAARSSGTGLGKDFVKFLGVFALMTILMFAFNSFSHGTQDLYPTFLTRGTSPCAEGGYVYHGGGEPRGACGRNRIWKLVGTDWKAARDSSGGAPVDSSDPVVGILALDSDARLWADSSCCSWCKGHGE